MRIDHVIYGTADLEAGAARLATQLGLEVVGGGRHIGLGTENRIIPLGDGYLEIITVVDRNEAATSAFGSAIMARIDDEGDGLVGWAAETDDIHAVAGRLGTAISVITRSGLSAHLAGVLEAMQEPYLPFFIQRDEGIPDPGVNADAGGITGLELAGDEQR